VNTLRTAFLMAALTGLFVGIGFLIGGPGGMLIAFLFAAGSNAFAYWNSDKLVLRMYGAEEVDARTAPRLYRIVETLARAAGLPMPRVYITQNDQPNAFATGRDPEHAAVCVTSGLLNRVDDNELAGVLAHELGHVKNRDTLTMTVTATIAGAVSMLANMGLWFGGGFGNGRRDGGNIAAVLILSILAPIAALLVQATISRTREFEADKAGAEISRHPLWLASALTRIEESAAITQNPEADAHPATAHMFIINPLSGGGIAGLFASHPPTEERVARLKAMVGVMSDKSPAKTSGVFEVPRKGPWG
jgi:heat shock protein HtpX